MKMLVDPLLAQHTHRLKTMYTAHCPNPCGTKRVSRNGVAVMMDSNRYLTDCARGGHFWRTITAVSPCTSFFYLEGYFGAGPTCKAQLSVQPKKGRTWQPQRLIPSATNKQISPKQEAVGESGHALVHSMSGCGRPHGMTCTRPTYTYNGTGNIGKTNNKAKQ